MLLGPHVGLQSTSRVTVKLLANCVCLGFPTYLILSHSSQETLSDLVLPALSVEPMLGCPLLLEHHPLPTAAGMGSPYPLCQFTEKMVLWSPP